MKAKEILAVDTSQAWLETALRELKLLLVDHAHCEKKAASTALGMIYRYPDKPPLLTMASQLAREELTHFDQVLGLLERSGWAYEHLSAGRYAAKLFGIVRKPEPSHLVDTLIAGAFIEARSHERLEALAAVLDPPFADFYAKLARSEARHFEQYLSLAYRYGDDSEVNDRIADFAALESELITSPDPQFRFHSGIPSS